MTRIELVEEIERAKTAYRANFQHRSRAFLERQVDRKIKALELFDEKRRKQQARYAKSEKGKKAHREAQARYRQSAKGCITNCLYWTKKGEV